MPGLARPVRKAVALMGMTELRDHLRDDHGVTFIIGKGGGGRIDAVTRHSRLHQVGADHGHDRVAVPEP